MALTTLAEVKRYLDVSVSTWDVVLAALQAAAEARVVSYVGKEIEEQTFTEYHDGRGLSRLVLKNRPVGSITSIHDDLDRDYETADLVDSDDYTFYPDAGIVELDAGSFQDGIRNVKVVYVAGYSTVPADVEIAVWKLTAAYWNQMRQGADGIGSERQADYQAAYEKTGMPEDVRTFLEPWTEIGV